MSGLPIFRIVQKEFKQVSSLGSEKFEKNLSFPLYLELENIIHQVFFLNIQSLFVCFFSTIDFWQKVCEVFNVNWI